MKMASNPQQMLPRNPYGRIRMTEFVIGGGKQFDKTRRGETTNEEITMYVSSKKSAMFFCADSENGNPTGCIGKGGAATHTRVANGLQELLLQSRSDLDSQIEQFKF